MKSYLSWKWLLSLSLPVAAYMLLAPLNIAGPQTPLFLAFTLWAVTAWAAELLPAPIIGAILTLLYTLFVTKPAVAFSSWTTFLPWMCFAALIIAQSLNRTGLGKRIALKCMLFLGASYTKTLIGFAISGIILALLVPSGLARVVVFVAIAQGLVSALDVDPNSRMSSSFILAAFMAAVAPGLFCVTATEMNLLAVQHVSQSEGITVSYVDFLFQMAPFSLFYIFISFLLIYVVRGKERLPDEGNLKKVLEERLAELGPVSRDEIKIFLILFIGFLAFVTEQWHGYPGAWLFAIIGMACFLPGIDLANEKDLRQINLGFLIFLAACMSIGAVAQSCDIPQWLAGQLSTIFDGLGPTTAITSSYILGVIANFLMTPMAAVGALSVPLAKLATTLSYDPYTFIYGLLYGLDQLLFPYEAGYMIYTFMSGCIRLRFIIGAFAIRMIAMAFFVPLLLVPYWRLIGFVQ